MKITTKYIFLITACLVQSFLVTGEVVPLDLRNIDSILENNQVVFVNFYADWCRFSRMLAPIFEDASTLIQKEFPEQGKVVMGKVDCDSQPNIAQKYHVNKYPTMKLFRGGELVKREYRGQRTAESVAAFVREQLRDPVKEFASLDEIYELPRERQAVIGYFESKESPDFETFEKVAKILKDDCNFHAGFGEVSKPERTSGNNVIYKPVGSNNPEMVYLGSLTNYNLLLAWTQDKCIPLVREITFANGEELTEEGLPFLILFHLKEDTESLEAYKKEVSRLVSFKSSINFLVADCQTFSHPLHHLGKSVRDCPLVAIDSFKHMYLFPTFEDIGEPGKLKQFILDLHSGKLHREFHHGPDPVIVTESTRAPDPDPTAKLGYHASLPEGVEDVNWKPSSPKPTQKDPIPTESNKDSSNSQPNADAEEVTSVRSIFVQLKPSELRYSLKDVVRDEL